MSYLYKQYSDIIKDVFIWAKTNTAPSICEFMPTNNIEYIFCFSKDKPETKIFSYCNFNNRKNNKIVYNGIIKPIQSEKTNHNYSFPIWLPSYFINHFSKENDLIYDPFIGSGTTALSALNLNRNYIGSEISKEYCELAEKRIELYKSQEKLF